MRKLLLLLLASLLLVACGDDSGEVEAESETEEENQQEKQEGESVAETEEVEEAEENEPDIEIYNDEAKEFVDKFNQLAVSTGEATPIDSVYEVEDSGSHYMQTFYSATEYAIYALYDKETDEVSSYNIVIPESQPYKEGEGSALYAMFTMASALEINLDDFAVKVEQAISNDNVGMFTDENHTVGFTDHEDPEIGMVVMFMNLPIENKE